MLWLFATHFSYGINSLQFRNSFCAIPFPYSGLNLRRWKQHAFFLCLSKAFNGSELGGMAPLPDHGQGRALHGCEPWSPHLWLQWGHRGQGQDCPSQHQCLSFPAGWRALCWTCANYTVAGGTWVRPDSWAATPLTFILDLCFPNFTTKLQEKTISCKLDILVEA
jgi:hypothetical protein